MLIVLVMAIILPTPLPFKFFFALKNEIEPNWTNPLSEDFCNFAADNDVVKMGAGGETYGIQIKQDYYSSNYGDHSYLFLMVDFNDPENPSIKVRNRTR